MANYCDIMGYPYSDQFSDDRSDNNYELKIEEMSPQFGIQPEEKLDELSYFNRRTSKYSKVPDQPYIRQEVLRNRL